MQPTKGFTPTTPLMSPMQTPSVPLSRPGYGSAGSAASIPSMGLLAAVAACFSKYIQFSGRSRRAEYWYWTLFTLLLQVGAAYALSVTMGQQAAGNAYSLLTLLLLLPGLAVLVRRLHDTDRSGWWFLLPLTGIGAFVLLVWLCQEGTNGTNRFGARTT